MKWQLFIVISHDIFKYDNLNMVTNSSREFLTKFTAALGELRRTVKNTVAGASVWSIELYYTHTHYHLHSKNDMVRSD